MKRLFIYGLIVSCFTVNILCSCEKEEGGQSYKKIETTTTSKITKPTVSVSSAKANSTYDGWWVIAKVTTGGDDPSNVECYLEWSKFSKKQTGSINYTNRDKMNVQSSSSTQVLFKKEHAGINSGTYIYYRLVGNNSKYSTTGAASYMVATKY
jgi:hypothetical protein